MSEYAFVQKGIATMYTRAEADGTRTDEVLYGMRVEILERSQGRTRIRTHYRYEGWVEDTALLPAESVSTVATDAVPVWISDRWADVLALPKIQGLPLATLPRGAFLYQTSPADQGWVQVQLLDGQTGYVHEHQLMKYIAPMTAEDIPDEKAFREALIQTAYRFLGAQYRWGGKTPSGVDCSGLCSTVYMQNGVLIYRDAKMPEGFPVHPIAESDMKPGDLYYFPGHIAMYIDEDHFIHSTSRAGYYGVVINSFNPEHPDYRPDLKAEILQCGSIF